MRKIGASLFVLATGLLVAAPAVAASSAAPQYVSSEPGRDEEMHEAPDSVSITFDQPLDPESYIVVNDHCDRRIDARDTAVTANQMEVGIAKKPSGIYHVTYFSKGLAGVTGQVTGIFTFTVHGGPACGPGAAHQHGGTKKHQGHGDDRGGAHPGHGGSGHAGHDAGTDHATGFGAHASGAHGGHTAASGTHADGHQATGHDGKGHAKHQAAEPRFPKTLASDDRGPSLRPDQAAVLLSLFLSVVLGILGGWVLRVSAPA